MTSSLTPAERAAFIRQQIPQKGLFAGYDWRISPEPFPISSELLKRFDFLGRILLQFYRATNLLYRQSVAGQQPSWIAAALDHGKPTDLVELQRSPVFRNEVPRVIRPDILLTQEGISIEELDKIPGTGAEGRLTKDDLLNYLQNPASLERKEETQKASYTPAQEIPQTLVEEPAELQQTNRIQNADP